MTEVDTTIAGSCSQQNPPGEIVITKLAATTTGSAIEIRTACTNGTFSIQPGFPLAPGMIFAALHIINGTQSPASAQVRVAAVPDADEHCTTDPELSIHRAFISPSNLADAFGYRIAHHFLALQITLANENKDFQFLVHNITINYRDLLRSWLQNHLGYGSVRELSECQRREILDALDQTCGPVAQNACKASSADLAMLRGVAEKGIAYDPRNVLIRSLEGLGAVGGSITGLIGGKLYSQIVSVFSGPFVNATARIFPDFTVNQMNRLNDLAYMTNTVIPKQQGRVVVVFLPQPLFLTNAEQKSLYKDAGAFLRKTEWSTFRRVGICVSGVHIAETNSLPPRIDNIVITSNMADFGADTPEIKGYLSGQFFPGGDLNISSPAGASIAKDGAPSNSKYPFVIRSTKPIPAGAVLTIQVVKPGDVAERSLSLSYVTIAPTIQAPVPASVDSGASDKQIAIAGTNFVKGLTMIDPIPGVTFTIDDSQSTATKLVSKVSVASDAAKGDRNLTVSIKGQPGHSNAVKLTIK